MPGIWIARRWLVTLSHVSLVPYPHSLTPPSLSHTDTFTLSPIALFFPSHFLSLLSPPNPFPYLYMSLHEQVQLSMKQEVSLTNHFSLIRL